jgi:glucosamine-6-phosphate deaminase
MLLGIGLNGHIGFNEPLTPFGSRTHIARISRTSRLARARLFGSLQRVPRLGMTMGMRTIMHARRILLISKGEGKADIMRRALYGEVTTRIPASVLQLHPELTVLVDPLAARYLPTAGPKPC